MKVTVQFVDGERIDGASEAMTLSKIGFPIVPDAGNDSWGQEGRDSRFASGTRTCAG